MGKVSDMMFGQSEFDGARDASETPCDRCGHGVQVDPLDYFWKLQYSANLAEKGELVCLACMTEEEKELEK